MASDTEGEPVACGLSHEERYAALAAEYGRPRSLPAGVAAMLLRHLGLRDQVHPYDTHAWAYRDRAAAEAYAASNAAHGGPPSLGIVPVDGAIAGVSDLRPVFTRCGLRLTDPALPDDWTPPREGKRP